MRRRSRTSRVWKATLIAAYRALDCTNGVGGNWGTAASNWVWGSVTSDDAYKGSESTDQPESTTSRPTTGPRPTPRAT